MKFAIGKISKALILNHCSFNNPTYQYQNFCKFDIGGSILCAIAHYGYTNYTTLFSIFQLIWTKVAIEKEENACGSVSLRVSHTKPNTITTPMNILFPRSSLLVWFQVCSIFLCFY